MFIAIYLLSAIAPLSSEWQHIGSLDMGKYEVFRPYHFAVSQQGLVCTIDPDQMQLVIVPFEGGEPIRCGHKGEGPGEFMRPGEVYWVDSGKCFFVSDFGNDRFSAWSEQGQLIAEYPKPLGAANPSFPGKGTVYFAKNKRGTGKALPEIYAYDLTRGEQQLLWQFTGETIRKYKDPGKRPILRYSPPWDSILVYAHGSDFLVGIYTQQARVYILDRHGKAQGSFDAGLARSRISKKTRDDYFRFLPAHQREGARKGLITPEYWPGVNRVFVDALDRIWLVGHAENEGDPFPVRICDKQGNTLFSLELPQIPVVLHNDHLYMYKDPDGESIIFKLSIRLPK